MNEIISTLAEADIYDQKIDRFLDPGTVKALSIIKPWRGIVQIALEWLGIAAGIILCESYRNWLLYFAAVIWIGARQHALGVLLHDTVHYRLLPNRKWNDWIGDIFTAWPLFVTVCAYRQNHWAHHRHVNKPGDPDWERKQNKKEFEFPKSGLHMALITLKYWLGFYAIKAFADINQAAKIPLSVKYLRFAFYAAVLVASIVFHFWLGLLIYWIVPLFTYFMWLVYVRGVSEHFGGIEDHEDLLKKTRHIEANLFERLFITPNYVHVHIGHHLYPSVPFYNLGKLQDRLMLNRDYAERAHVTKGYVALVNEVLGESKQGEPCHVKPVGDLAAGDDCPRGLQSHN